MPHDVFISHSSKDKLIADATCAVLEHHGIRCWIAPRDILPGSTWCKSIVDALVSARVMVLIFSGHANVSPQIEREIERAVSRGIPIIPVRIEDVQPAGALEYFLGTSHWLDAFSQPLERHLDYLVQVLQKILAGPDGDHPTPTPPAPTQPSAPPAPPQPAPAAPAPPATAPQAQAEAAAPTEPGRPSSRTPILIGAGILGLLLLGVAVGGAYIWPRPKPPEPPAPTLT